MSEQPLVLVVDDDDDVRDSVRVLLESAGYAVKDHASARALLADDISDAACLVADIVMPGMDGLELQEELSRRTLVPVIIMTGHGDVPRAVRAMKAGAVDFIEKPFDAEVMLSSVQRAVQIARQEHDHGADGRSARRMLAMLTPRERTVLDQLMAGRSNKIAAYMLGISPRTIEIHRAHIMEKMHAHSLSELVRVSLAASAIERPGRVA